MFKTSGGHYVVPVTKRCVNDLVIEPENYNTIKAGKESKYDGCSEPDEISNAEMEAKDIDSGTEHDAVTLAIFSDFVK